MVEIARFWQRCLRDIFWKNQRQWKWSEGNQSHLQEKNKSQADPNEHDWVLKVGVP